jgi:hypothetical protein
MQRSRRGVRFPLRARADVSSVELSPRCRVGLRLEHTRDRDRALLQSKTPDQSRPGSFSSALPTFLLQDARRTRLRIQVLRVPAGWDCSGWTNTSRWCAFPADLQFGRALPTRGGHVSIDHFARRSPEGTERRKLQPCSHGRMHRRCSAVGTCQAMALSLGLSVARRLLTSAAGRGGLK